jgi:hypothetical protein
MDANARVSWYAHPSPWELETELIENLRLPFNIEGNREHSFYSALQLARTEALKRARELPVCT